MPRFLVPLTATLALVAAVPASAAAPPALQEYTGAMHEHSAYSDGWPGSTPATFYKSGRDHGLDFFVGSDHSDTLEVPNSASHYCLDNDPSDAALCAFADPVQANALAKWPSTLKYADEATTPAFTGIRGFEWSSDRFGHITVMFSSNVVNAKVDGGNAAMGTFYGWLARPAMLQGGSDGIATFDHPGAKRINNNDPGFNWDDFAFDPKVDDQMVGLEVFNDHNDYASPRSKDAGDDGWYAHALDKGWHLGAVGAEDLGHDKVDDWGGPDEPKTVLAATDRSRDALKAALRARRSYAVRRTGFALTYTADEAPMGSRLERTVGAPVRLRATASARDGMVGAGRHLESDLVTSGGKVVATAVDGKLDVARPATAGERYYFVRVREVGPARGSVPAYDQAVAFSSPVWVTARAAGATGASGATGSSGASGSSSSSSPSNGGGGNGDTSGSGGSGSGASGSDGSGSGASGSDGSGSGGSGSGGSGSGGSGSGTSSGSGGSSSSGSASPAGTPGSSGAAGPAGPSGPAGATGTAGTTGAAPSNRRSFHAALRARRGQTRAALARRGLLVQVGCDVTCSTTVTVSGTRGRLARRTAALTHPGRRELVLRVPRSTHGRLVVRLTARSADGQTRTQRIVVRVR